MEKNSENKFLFSFFKNIQLIEWYEIIINIYYETQLKSIKYSALSTWTQSNIMIINDKIRQGKFIKDSEFHVPDHQVSFYPHI